MINKMHVDELDIDTHLVHQLLHLQFPQWADLPLEAIGAHGGDNRVFRLGKNMVIRLPRIKKSVISLENDCQWLGYLAPHLPIPIPTLIAKADPSSFYPWPWMISKWIPGDHPTVESLRAPNDFTQQIAFFIKALHHIAASQGPISSRGRTLLQRDVETRECLNTLSSVVDTAALLPIWEEALAAPSWDKPGVWVHGDLSPLNILVTGTKLAAVLDFGLIGIGDPACDLYVAWCLLAASERPIFRTAVGVDDATWTRGRGWALSIALSQLSYYQDTNPKLIATASHVIHEILAASQENLGHV